MARKKPNAAIPTLVGKGRQGDFVHQTQTMGVQKGFKNVSQHWLDTGCLSYNQVVETITRNRAEIEDFRIPLSGMTPTITDNLDFVMVHEGVPFKPTEFALTHIAKWSGNPFLALEILAGFRNDINDHPRNRPEDRQVFLRLLETGFSLIPPKKHFLFRTQTDGTLRAMLSDKYEIMDNLWFLEVLKDIIPGGVFSHWKDDGDYSTLWGNILIPDTIRAEPDSDYGAMYSIGNSEIGRRKLSARPSLFRAICMNGCIWDRTLGTAFQQRHVGKIDLMVLRMQLRKHLTDQIPLVNTAIDSLMGTKAIGWDGAAAKQVFASLGQRYNLNKAINTDILKAWRQQSEDEPIFQDDSVRRSAFGVINAVTRSSNDIKADNPAEWVKRDELGGQLLSWKKDDWSYLFSQARSMKKEDVVSSFTKSDI